MTFEEQFENRIKVKTPGGIVDVIDISPKEESENIPIFLSSGWASTPKLLKPLLKSITENGKRIITIDFENINYSNQENKKYKTRENLKAEAILDTLNYLNINKANIIGHSEGAVNATLVVEKNPSKFKSLLLVAPAGMIKNESFFKLAKRITLSFLLWPKRKMHGKNRPLAHVLQNFKFILFNPIQSLGEGYGLSKIYIGEIVKELISRGIIVNLIYFKDDVVFPQQSIKKNASENNIPLHIEIGTHNYIYSKPNIFWNKINHFFE